jgi:ATP-binding cassette subfamily B multidrug efflux pump
MHFPVSDFALDTSKTSFDRKLSVRLFRLLSRYRRLVAFTLILSLVSSGLKLVGPYLIKIAIDQNLTPGKLEGLGVIAAIYVLASLLDFFARSGQLYMMQWTGQKVMFDLRMKLFEHIHRLPLKYFDKTPIGKTMTRVTNDVEALNELFTSGVVTILSDIFMLLGIVAMLLYLNLQLALVSFIVLPIMFFASKYFRNRLRTGFRLVRERVAILNATMQENLSGLSVIKLFAREKQAMKGFEEVNAKERDAFLDTIFYFALFMPVIELMGALSVGLILWYGGGQVIRDALTLGALVAFIEYTQKFFRPVSDITEKFNVLQSAMAASERIFGLLDKQPEPEGGRITPGDGKWPEKIEFKNVTFSYDGDKKVLKDVSFTINHGEKIAVVGPTGAGKSTIVNLLMGFYRPQAGQILIDGIPCQQYDVKKLRGRMGLTLQDVFLFSDTVEENIRLHNPDIDIEKVGKATRHINADKFISQLPQGLSSQVKERGSILSQGQRQLISFARVLVYNPDIMILDEATSNIDPATETLIQDALEKLMNKRTSIIIAHRLSTIKNVDRIIVLHKGKIHETGDHEDLMALQGIYFKLYQLQCASEQIVSAGIKDPLPAGKNDILY